MGPNLRTWIIFDGFQTEEYMPDDADKLNIWAHGTAKNYAVFN